MLHSRIVWLHGYVTLHTFDERQEVKDLELIRTLKRNTKSQT